MTFLWFVMLEPPQGRSYIFHIGTEYGDDAVEYAKIWLLEEGLGDFLRYNLNPHVDRIGTTKEIGIITIRLGRE